MALSGNQVTGFSLYGGIARAYGDFSGKTPVVPIEVPDVVGETQAAGTTELEAAGFVVAVVTAFSSVVAAGLIISQDPAGGELELPGTTVTITVSLGDEPVTARPRGGDDARHHRGWDRTLALKKKTEDEKLHDDIRALYRKLTGQEDFAARAEAIVAPIVAPVAAEGESAEARLAAEDERIKRLAERIARNERDAIHAEMALRLLHEEQREAQEDEDLRVIQLALSQVL